MKAQMPLYDPEDPRWEAWQQDQRRARMEDAFRHRHYRHGEEGVLARYIVRPTDGLFNAGVTVSDMLVALAVAPLALGWVWLVALAFGPVA